MAAGLDGIKHAPKVKSYSMREKVSMTSKHFMRPLKRVRQRSAKSANNTNSMRFIYNDVIVHVHGYILNHVRHHHKRQQYQQQHAVYL